MRRVCAIVLLAVALSGTARAWGPATHMYIAECVTESRDPGLLFASAVPDMNATLLNAPQSASCLQRLLHDHPEMLPDSFFAIGMATHNSLWGADYYAHLFFHPENPECDTTYSTIKVRQFSADLGISIGQAEDLLEMTVDYLVRLDRGPGLGRDIKAFAALFGPAEEQMLVDAYAEALAACVPGYTVPDAESDIRTACTAFRIITTMFGEQLLLSDDQITYAIPPLLARYLHVDAATARTYFEHAVASCGEDYRAELDRICAILCSRMDEMPEYQMPVGRWGAAVLGGVLGWLILCKMRNLHSSRLH